MGIIRCTMCGGALTTVPGSTVAKCEHCGSLQTVPGSDDQKMLNRFVQSCRLRLEFQFDKAARVYTSLAEEYPEEPEAYWGLLLCKNGVVYEDDPTTGQKVPAFYRTSFDSITADPAYHQTLSLANEASLNVYLEEIKKLESARNDIIKIASNENPYDIFLCCKETDEDGDWTQDSRLAQNVYHVLTSYGYRVFLPRICLAGKTRQEREPYIFGALRSSKVMLVFETGNHYCNDVWVRGEWRRYLQRMASDKAKRLISCIQNVSIESLPKALSKRPSVDMGQADAIPNLLHALQKTLPKTSAIREMERKERIERLTAACQEALANEDLSTLEELCMDLLAVDDDNIDGCFYMLLVEHEITELSELLNLDSAVSLEGDVFYHTMLDHAPDDPRTQQLQRVNAILLQREEEERQRAEQEAQRIALEEQRRELYEEGLDNLSYGAYQDALAIFEEVSKFRDVHELIAMCHEGIRFQKLKKAYRSEVGDGKTYLTKRFKRDRAKEYQAYFRLHKMERRFHRRCSVCLYLSDWAIVSFILLGAAGLCTNSSFLPLVFLGLLVYFVVRLTFSYFSFGFFRKLITAIFMLGMDVVVLFLLAELDGIASVGLYAALLAPIPIGIFFYLQKKKLARQIEALEQGAFHAYSDQIRQELTEKYGSDVTKLVSLKEVSWVNDPQR